MAPYRATSSLITGASDPGVKSIRTPVTCQPGSTSPCAYDAPAASVPTVDQVPSCCTCNSPAPEPTTETSCNDTGSSYVRPMNDPSIGSEPAWYAVVSSASKASAAPVPLVAG